MRLPPSDGPGAGPCGRPGAERVPTAWVSNEKDNTISVIDVARSPSSPRSRSGSGRAGSSSRPIIATLYICASDSDAVQVLDVATAAIVADLPSGADPEFFALDPAGRLSLHRQRGRRDHDGRRHGSRRVVAQIDVGIEPEGMAISHDGRWAVTTSETTNMVHWIDTASHERGRQHAGRPAAALRAVQR